MNCIFCLWSCHFISLTLLFMPYCHLPCDSYCRHGASFQSVEVMFPKQRFCNSSPMMQSVLMPVYSCIILSCVFHFIWKFWKNLFNHVIVYHQKQTFQAPFTICFLDRSIWRLKLVKIQQLPSRKGEAHLFHWK